METQRKAEVGTLGESSLQHYISDGTSELIRKRYAGLLDASSRADYGDLDNNIVVIDTEATGFSLNHDELTQIAAARIEHGEIADWYVTFVNPGKPIPEEVAHLTNIHDEDVACAPQPAEALAGLVEFVGEAKLVAHNAEFDRNFTTKHPSGYSLLGNVWIDSLDLARIALPRMKSHRLLDLVRAFGLPLSTHRADADVEATCRLFRVLLAAVDAMPASLVREIARMAPREQWPTSIVFKHFAEKNAKEQAEAVPAKEQAEAALAKATTEAVSGEIGKGSGEIGKSFQQKGIRNASLAGEETGREAGREAGEETGRESGREADRETGKKADKEAGKGFGQERFSLYSLRKERVGSLERKAKLDAENIASDPQRELVFPSKEEVAAAFSKAGLVGSLYADFEPRVEQAAMAEAVRDAFARSENLMVEAGTGVGKSMAYLVPAVLTARANNITVGVATKTNALLDQLVYHELPALKEAFGSLSFAPLKGFSHYPCLRRVDKLVSEGPQVREVAGKEYSQAPCLAALLSYIEQTEYDDMDALKIDYRVLSRRTVTTSSNDCLRRKCPYYGHLCFVHGARRLAESADVVVTNHSLLFCDLAADGGLLPPIRYWVVDEAHGAEAEARRAFSISLSAEKIGRLSQRVAAADSPRNVFARAERRVAACQREEKATLFYALSGKARTAGTAFSQAANEFLQHMKDLLFFDASKRSKGYDHVELWINDDVRRSETFSCVASFEKAMSAVAEALVTACQEIVGYLEDVEGAAEVQREIASIAMELKDTMHAAEVIFERPSDSYVYSATLNRKNDKANDLLEASLVNVGEKLEQTLYANTHSVVFASATLTVDGSFAAFQTALGLNTGENTRCAERKLDSSYDYDEHMAIYVVNDIPEPNEPGYLQALQKLLVDAHRAQRGSMLTLFTNRREMEKCFEVVQPELKADDLRLVCQKWGVSVKGLRDDFLADEHLSLFALKSFWEGFDAPGATLKGVIIPKLPFAKPTDPLSCERAQRDDQAWRRYVLPAAVLETKQAAGRLIRKADDEGVLILADKRLVTKSYGRAFLNSLPSRNIKICSTSEIVKDLAQSC